MDYLTKLILLIICCFVGCGIVSIPAKLDQVVNSMDSMTAAIVRLKK